jgi:hypothetical protein
MLDRAPEGHAHLEEYARFVETHAPKDVWRNVQLTSHRALFLELTGAPDAQLEQLFEEHAALGMKPSAFAHALRHFYVAKAYRRLAQAFAPGAGRAELRRLTHAVGCLSSIRKHPTLDAHTRVVEGGLSALKGQPAEASWVEAGRIASATDNAWVEFEVAYWRAQAARRGGDETAAVRGFAAAHGVARTRALPGLLKRPGVAPENGAA